MTHKAPRRRLLTGTPASAGTAVGSVASLETLVAGSTLEGDIILVAETVPPTAVLLPNIRAIVTDEGGILSHAATLARELQIPCVVGTGNATQTLRQWQRVVVIGDLGEVYDDEDSTQ